MTFKTLGTAAFLAVAATTGAQAATIYATGATIISEGPRGTANGRDDITNSFGAPDSEFFELGRGATVDFTFGQLFTGPGTVFEITFGDIGDFPESVDVFGGASGAFTFLGSLINIFAGDDDGETVAFTGIYDTLRLVDTSMAPILTSPGGFDVDSIAVSTIPVPAAGVLLLGALGALGLARRRKA